MNLFATIADPVRRRVLDLLVAGERTAGDLTAAVQAEFGISQPAVSAQLRSLRDAGFVAVRPEGSRRHYSLTPARFRELDGWLEPYRRLWAPRLETFPPEFGRGKGQRGSVSTAPLPATPQAGAD